MKRMLKSTFYRLQDNQTALLVQRHSPTTLTGQTYLEKEDNVIQTAKLKYGQAFDTIDCEILLDLYWINLY